MIILIVFHFMVTQIRSDTIVNITLNCTDWTNKHVVLAKDVHYYNVTFAFVKIDTLDDLNITTQCSTFEYNIENLKIFAKKSILLNNDLNLSGVLNIFNRSNSQIDVLLQNVNGFNANSRDIKKTLINNGKSMQLSNVIFDFYSEGHMITNEICKSENFDSKTNFFGNIKALLLTAHVCYNSKICPYVFMNTQLEQLFLGEISNSLIFRNRIEFVSVNKTSDFDMNIKTFQFLVLNFFCETLSSSNLNPFVFKTLTYLLIKGKLEHIEANLFEGFQKIRFISIKSDELINFFHLGTKWLNSINKDLNVNLKKKLEFRGNTHRLVSIEIAVQSWSMFNTYYTFPNEDICLFKDFPHSQLILPLIIFDASRFEYIECTCTLVWLQQYYKLYFYNNFSQFNEYINIEPAYKDFFANETLMKCHQSEEYFDEKFLACNFSQRFENCNFTHFNTVSINGNQSLTLMIKWLQYIIEVYIRTILCSIGLITNLLTLKVIRNKNHKKNFSNSMYKHIRLNALFNVGFCLIYLASLMNICIFQKTSFCSSINRTEFAQYFYIYVILFLGNTFRLCCNISYIFFSVSRFALSGTSNESKLRKFIEKQNIKRFYILFFFLTLGFSVFLVFENYVNKNFQDFDLSFDFNNAYDIKYCDSFRSDINFRKYILKPSFYVKCKLFQALNVINNILNNVLFLFISIFVDIFMIRYSNKVIEKKKQLNSPHLAEAIQYKTKLNKMIITNGTLFIFSHFPDFLSTMVFYFYKSKDFIDFCLRPLIAQA
jgi:hypothetical protein